MNLQDKVSMDLVPPSDHLCYVCCNFCNTVLVVGIPFKRLLDSVTVKCGHCSNLSFLSTSHYNHTLLTHRLDQGIYSEILNKGPASSSSSSSATTTGEPTFVVKPPEKKHRPPSAYNRFMKEEIQRIKAANPEIAHREAFSAAAKNWAGYIPNSPRCRSSISGGITNNNE